MLYGRSKEQADIERLLAEARAGQSGTLVIRGQAGIGKSALLHHAAARAEDMRVLRGVGIESEAELPFAALHSLLRTELGQIRTLPDAQATALSGALGLGDIAPENRFLVGLATLSLLSEVAGDGALLCLIDDAQWCDQASIGALLFAARRLDAEGVAMIFAARGGFPAAGLPELRLGGLDNAAAAALLPDVLPPQVRERLIEEADGNPLALIELPAALTAEQRAGRLSPVGAMPVPDRVQEMFRNQIAALPEAARTALLIAAADGSGDLETVVGAGASLRGLESAERNRLVEIRGTTIGFRHPLIRAAAYQSAPVTRRLAVHRALADALTASVAVDAADRRAWHLASAVLGTDEEVARELEEVAERARTRSGYAAIAAAYERAAELTADPVRRSGRLAAAALAASDAGLMGRAAALADSATPDVDDPIVIGALIQVRAHREFEQGTPLAAGRIIMDGVPRVAARSSEWATWLLVEAIRCAWSAGDAGLAEEAAAGLCVLPEIGSPLVRGAAIGRWALGRLELGLGRPDAALQQFEAISLTGIVVLSAADQVEAAIRGGRPERAKEPLARYLEWARHVRQPSPDAIALRCRALVEGDEAHFAHAVRCHEAGDQPYEQARTRLAYGEWLRRARRRADARAQLRGALEIFDRLGTELWAERARAELRATGDVPAAPRKADDPLSVLTPRERQIVRLAANGTSNRDIAAQLFLSPRTVGYHLYKAFPKLGITSRSQLAAVARSSPVPD